jgi:hypothetical protein
MRAKHNKKKKTNRKRGGEENARQGTKRKMG